MINQAILDIVSKDYTYSVVGQCNGCQLCEFLAVNNFSSVRGEKGFQVVRQPVTWEEKEQCYEAMERCPLHGIVRSERVLPARES
jgi:ferredoxin